MVNVAYFLNIAPLKLICKPNACHVWGRNIIGQQLGLA